MAKQYRHDVEIIGSTPGQSGLKLTNLTATNATTYVGILAHDATGNVVSISGTNVATITVGPVAPTSPIAGQQWLDTSVTPSELMVYNGTVWELANDEVQHYANFAAFPVTGLDNVLYIDDAIDNAYVWDSTTTAYVSVIGGASGLFSISDGVTTQAVGVGNTITFTEESTIADVLDVEVIATDTVRVKAVAGHTVGQAIVSDGTKFVYGFANAKRFASTITPVANVAQTVNHNMNTLDPIVQLRDATTNEVISAQIDVIDANNITVTSTTVDTIRVTVL